MSSSIPKPSQPPPLFTKDPESVLNETKALISKIQSTQDRIVSTFSPENATFTTTLLPLIYAEQTLSLRYNILTQYSDVSPSLSLRNASEQAEELLGSFWRKTFLREDLFLLIDAVLHNNEDIDNESRRLLEKKHRAYVKNGLSLDKESREKFKEIQKEVKRLEREYRNNIGKPKDDSLFFSVSELDGLPTSFIKDLKPGEPGTDEADRLKVPLGHSLMGTVYSQARNGEVRRAALFAGMTPYADNIPIFRQVVLLRDQAARLLGYKNHAYLNIEEKLARTPETVHRFLDEVRKKLKELGVKELEALARIKREDLVNRGAENVNEPLKAWDVYYYQRIEMQNKFQLDKEALSQYFELEGVVASMLGIFEQLFGMKFYRVDENEYPPEGNNSIKWHPDVHLYSVWDSKKESQPDSNDFLGYLYTDLVQRDDKPDQVYNRKLQSGFVKEDGTRHYPVTALICAFDKPTAKKPTLLSHFDMKILFHELGHGIHELVSKTTYGKLHGTNGPVDFGEGPSQMLENYCWVPTVLQSLGRHYTYLKSEYLEAWKMDHPEEEQPSERLSDEILSSLMRTRKAHQGLFELRNLRLALFDLMVYDQETHQDAVEYDIPLEFLRLGQNLIPIDDFETLGKGSHWNNAYTAWTHPMSDEYSAGYYSYF